MTRHVLKHVYDITNTPPVERWVSYPRSFIISGLLVTMGCKGSDAAGLPKLGKEKQGSFSLVLLEHSFQGN